MSCPRPAPCCPKPHAAGATGAQGATGAHGQGVSPRRSPGEGRLISMPSFAAAAPQSVPGRDTNVGSTEGSAVCVQSRVPVLPSPTTAASHL